MESVEFGTEPIISPVRLTRKGNTIEGAIDVYFPDEGIYETVTDVEDIPIEFDAADWDDGVARDVVGGFWSDVAKPFVKTAKKVHKTVTKGAKKVVRSNITRGALVGLSVVVPAAGVPALAAYETANVVLDQIEKGKKLRRKATKLVKSLKRSKKRPTRRQRKLIKRGRAAGKKARFYERKVKRVLRSNKPRARRMKKVLGIVAAQRKRASGMQGILVTRNGALLRGSWSQG